MSLTCDVWISAAHQQQLVDHLFPGDDDEHGAVLKAGIVESQGALRLLVKDVEVALDGRDYVPGQHGYRALNPTFIHKQIINCRNERLAYLAVHNHGSDQVVDFSTIDMESHERGYPALSDIGKGVPVGALVFGRRSVQADIWLPDGRRAKLGEFRVIGQSVKRFYPAPLRIGAGPSEYDRQLRMFGASGQAILKRAKVAIVGLGGVGSLVSEYLAHLGVGHLLLIDPDPIERTNLARVVGATSGDVSRKTLKVSIASKLAREANPSITVTEIPHDVTHCDVAASLRDVDYIFLCADSMRARLLVNAITHQYFVPTVQLGAKIQGAPDGSLVDATSVIRTIRPGDGCLWCNGFIPSGQLAVEAKSDEERKAQAYGTSEPNPSVISLNAVAAAHGVNSFLFDFLGLREPAGEARYEHHHFLRGKVEKVIPRREQSCSECVERFGRGDAQALPCIGTSAHPPQEGGWLSRVINRLRARFA